MDPRYTSRESALNALVIVPDREVADQFAATLPETRAFQVLADMKSYPSRQTLDIRLRQLRPDVVLLDVASDLDLACDLITFISTARPPVHVIGLHRLNDSAAIVRILRLGATEFLHAPFEVTTQRDAVARIRRLRSPETDSPPELGQVVVFSSAKPGSGASTLATQTAWALARLTSKSVLLIDLNLDGGTIGFSLGVNHPYSVYDALQHADQLDSAAWSALAASLGGFDLLPAPDVPSDETVEPSRLHELLEYARMHYDWVILDVPIIFHRLGLLALSESDNAFLVATSELPSLHLARRAVGMLIDLGFGKERFQLVVNRTRKSDGIGASDMEKILNCPVRTSLPNDHFSLNRTMTSGVAMDSGSELGKAVESMAGRLAGLNVVEKKRSTGLFAGRAAN